MLVRTNTSWLPQLFDEIFNDSFYGTRTMSRTTPSINVLEHNDAYELQIAAPGMTRDDIKVTLNEEENLVITIEKKAHSEDKSEDKNTSRYLRREFTHTRYSQTFVLPEDVKRDDIAATAQDGILTINLPKVTPEEIKREVKEIAIN